MITVNGVKRTLEQPLSVTEYLEKNQYVPVQVAIELNDQILARELYESTILKEGDVMEIVSFMGGGSGKNEEMDRTEDKLILGGHEFTSRFILGSGKFSLDLVKACIEKAGTQIITLALRRANQGGLANILDYIPKNITLLPNTSGARNAEEAVRIARLSRELGCGDFVKIEVIHDSKYLLPDNYETIKATEILAKEGFVVISGLARGIDTYAHLGAVKASGKTIAVLGSGLKHIYPSENKKLCNEIVKNGGAIITEYEPHTKPLPMNFPSRNRIISGLSNGVLVVEAKQKSGTLITVDYALEQGKDVFVIPGNITSINSYGTNELIKQGAKLVTNTKEIIEEIIK